jgi:hypothetical protein
VIIESKTMVSFPEAILHLRKLQSLALHCNDLEAVPEGITRLSGLEFCEITSDRIATVSMRLRKALRGMSTLERYIVHGTHLWFELNRTGYEVHEVYKKRSNSE